MLKIEKENKFLTPESFGSIAAAFFLCSIIVPFMIPMTHGAVIVLGAGLLMLFTSFSLLYRRNVPIASVLSVVVILLLFVGLLVSKVLIHPIIIFGEEFEVGTLLSWGILLTYALLFQINGKHAVDTFFRQVSLFASVVGVYSIVMNPMVLSWMGIASAYAVTLDSSMAAFLTSLSLIALLNIFSEDTDSGKIMHLTSFVFLCLSVVFSGELFLVLYISILSFVFLGYKLYKKDISIFSPEVVGVIAIACASVLMTFGTSGINRGITNDRPSFEHTTFSLKEMYRSNDMLTLFYGYGPYMYTRAWSRTAPASALKDTNLLDPVRSGYSTNLTFLAEYGLVTFPLVVVIFFLVLMTVLKFRLRVQTNLYGWTMLSSVLFVGTFYVLNTGTLALLFLGVTLLMLSRPKVYLKDGVFWPVVAFLSLLLLLCGLYFSYLGMKRVISMMPLRTFELSQLQSNSYRQEILPNFLLAYSIDSAPRTLRVLCFLKTTELREVIDSHNIASIRGKAEYKTIANDSGKYCDELRAFDPVDYRVRVLLALSNVQRARFFGSTDFLRQALSSLKDAYGGTKNFYLISALAAQIQISLGQYEKARLNIDAALKLEPNAPDVLQLLKQLPQ